MIFYSDVFDLRDKAGEVRALGVRWCEARTTTEAMMFAVGKGLFMLAPMIAVASVVAAIGFGREFAFAGFVLAALTIALSWFCSRAAWRIEGKSRDLVFHANGAITSSTGVGGPSGAHHTWRAQIGDINSFEAEELRRKKSDDELPYTHGVRMILKRGGVFHIAKDIEPDAAAGLAVALTIALHEVLSGGEPQGSILGDEEVW